MTVARRGPRRAVTPRESRVVVVSPELVELVRELREHFAANDLTAVELEFLRDALRREDGWIAASIVLHPAVGPQVQLELRPADGLRSLVAHLRLRTTRATVVATGTEGSR